MRIVTSYACTLDVQTADEAGWRFDLYRGVMDDWLRDQGISDPPMDSPSDTFVQLKRHDLTHEAAQVDGFLRKQPILESSHVLQTRFELAASERSLALYLQFKCRLASVRPMVRSLSTVRRQPCRSVRLPSLDPTVPAS